MRGEFLFSDVQAASYSLWAFNGGLLSFMLIKILANGYYARQDTKTPVKWDYHTLAIWALIYLPFRLAMSAWLLLGNVRNTQCLFAAFGGLAKSGCLSFQ